MNAWVTQITTPNDSLLHALPHNYATKAQLVTMGRPEITQKLPLLLRRSPPPSNTPIPRPNPFTIPHGIQIQSAVLPQYTMWTNKQTDQVTDRRSRRMFHNMSTPLAMLIESNALIITIKITMTAVLYDKIVGS